MKQALSVKAEDVPSAPFPVLRYEGDRQLSGIDRSEQREVLVPPLPLTYSEPQYLHLLWRPLPALSSLLRGMEGLH